MMESLYRSYLLLRGHVIAGDPDKALLESVLYLDSIVHGLQEKKNGFSALSDSARNFLDILNFDRKIKKRCDFNGENLRQRLISYKDSLDSFRRGEKIPDDQIQGLSLLLYNLSQSARVYNA